MGLEIVLKIRLEIRLEIRLQMGLKKLAGHWVAHGTETNLWTFKEFVIGENICMPTSSFFRFPSLA